MLGRGLLGEHARERDVPLLEYLLGSLLVYFFRFCVFSIWDIILFVGFGDYNVLVL